MADGTVKRFNESKGFGPMASDGGTGVFVHYSTISGNGFKSLAVCGGAAFETGDGQKAINVVKN